MLYNSHILSKRKTWRKEDFTYDKNTFESVNTCYRHRVSTRKNSVLTKKKTRSNPPGLFRILLMIKNTFVCFKAIIIIAYLVVSVNYFSSMYEKKNIFNTLPAF